MKSLGTVGLFLVVTLACSSAALAQEAPDPSAVVVPVKYTDGVWLANGEVFILPCEARNEPGMAGDTDPMIRIAGESMKEAFVFRMMNPRLVLPEVDKSGEVESPAPDAGLQDQIEAMLVFELMDGMEQMEFYENPREQKEPSLVVSLLDAIKKYEELGGPDQEASCQTPDDMLVPDKDRKQ